MNRRQHGILSLILFFIAVGIGIICIGLFSPIMSITYLFLSVISFLIIFYSYCSKCTCRKYACGHVLPGKITRFLPQRIAGSYSIRDYIGVTLPLGVIVAFPQFWLKDNIPLLILFWILLFVAVVDILLKVCQGCKNKYCSISKTS